MFSSLLQGAAGRLFEQRLAEKSYLAIVDGHLRCAAGGMLECTGAIADDPARAFPRRLSALSVSHSKSCFYGTFVWARRALYS
jgi:hypothetical protein